MRIIPSVGILVELDDDEMQKVREIAADLNCPVEKAIETAIQNFLKTGVQTPKMRVAS